MLSYVSDCIERKYTPGMWNCLIHDKRQIQELKFCYHSISMIKIHSPMLNVFMNKFVNVKCAFNFFEVNEFVKHALKFFGALDILSLILYVIQK